VARAIVKEAEKRKILLSPVRGFERVAGKGVKGSVGGKAVYIGGEAMLGVILLMTSRKTR
jgi:Cu+-exporting ATPase